MDFPSSTRSAATASPAARWTIQHDAEALFETILEKVPPPRRRRGRSRSSSTTSTTTSTSVVLRSAHRLRTSRQSAGRRHQENVKNRRTSRSSRLRGLKRTTCQEATAGEIIAIAGIEDIDVGDTITDTNEAGERALPASSSSSRRSRCASASHVAVRRKCKLSKYLTSRQLASASSRGPQEPRASFSDTTPRHVTVLGERAPARHPRRDDAPRGYEMQLGNPRSSRSRRTASTTSRTSSSSSTCPTSTSASHGAPRPPQGPHDQDGQPRPRRARLEFRIRAAPHRLPRRFLTSTRGTGSSPRCSTAGAVGRRDGEAPARRDRLDRQGVCTPYAMNHLQAAGVLREAGEAVYEA